MKQCPLCGYRFEEGWRNRCSQCPFNHGCQLVCCPNCGYEFPEDSRLVQTLKKWLQKRKKDQKSHVQS